MPTTSSRPVDETAEEAELRLELTTAEVRQVWALYSGPLQAMDSGAPPEREQPPAPNRASLGDLLSLAWRWRRTLMQSTVVALALGTLFLFVATPTFRVTALVLVEPRDAAAEVRGAEAGAPGFLAGQAEILAGAAIVRDAVVRSGLDAAGDAGGWLARLFPRAPRDSDEIERKAVARALGAFSAAPVPGTEVIALEYRTRDPAVGVRFVEAAIDRYAEFSRALEPGGSGVTVRTLAAPTRQTRPLWPRPLPVLLSCLVMGLLAGLALAVRADREQEPESEWTEIREAAWAA